MNRIKKMHGAVIMACLFIACSNSTPNDIANQSSQASGNANAGDSTYTGNNSFAYTINGWRRSIKDFMHDGDGKNWMALYLNKVKNDPATGTVKVKITNQLTKEVFDFSVANSGTTTILHYSPTLFNHIDKKSSAISYMSSRYKNYYGDSVMITITSITATRVAGKFSGKFLSDDDKPATLAITDGSFDVPFTKDKDN
ncbi:MAG: hypothetical protein ABI707_12345 [Ferruginibacter sp.]